METGEALRRSPHHRVALGNSGTNLIVQRNLTKTGGGMQYGNVLVSGNATLSTPTITGTLRVNGNTYINPSGGGSVAGGIVHNGTLAAGTATRSPLALGRHRPPVA